MTTITELADILGDDRAEEIEEYRRRTTRRLIRGALVACGIVIAFVLLILWVSSGDDQLDHELDARFDSAMAGQAALAAELDEANARLEAAPGATPVQDPEDVVEEATGEPAPAVIIGRPGRDGTDGADSTVPGPPGKDGATIVGPAGREGDPGEPGERGDQGEPGDRGDQGDRGEPGQPGADGRGILSQECVDGDYVTTYTDGTTGTITDSPACPQPPPIDILP